MTPSLRARPQNSLSNGYTNLVDVDVHSRGGHVIPCSSLNDLNAMTSKGKREKAGGAAAVVEEPPEREVVPGKITESQW